MKMSRYRVAYRAISVRGYSFKKKGKKRKKKGNKKVVSFKK